MSKLIFCIDVYSTTSEPPWDHHPYYYTAPDSPPCGELHASYYSGGAGLVRQLWKAWCAISVCLASRGACEVIVSYDETFNFHNKLVESFFFVFFLKP